MSLKLMGRKRGMTKVFDEKGHIVPCTVIELEPNTVVQVKTVETDGYNAIQLGCVKVKGKDPRTLERRTPKPQRGHFKKAGMEPLKHLQESRIDKVEEHKVGQELNVTTFTVGQHLDVTAISKGKGFAGVMKKHNYSGGPAAHGSGFHRSAGSTGMRSTPGRCLPGGKRASQMGNKQVTVQNIKVVEIVENENLLVLKGAVPGANNALVTLSPAVKKTAK